MEVCQNQTSVGYQYDGGFAEYMIVPSQVLKVDGLNRIPDNVGYDEASAAEPFACAINAQEQLGIEEGDFTVVFGAGPIGCMHIRIARGVHKVGTVVLVDINAERLQMSADAVQPDHVINASRGRRRRGGHEADRRPRRRRHHHRDPGQRHPGAGHRDGRPPGPDLVLRRPAQDRPDHHGDSNLIHYRQLHIHGANGSSPDHNKRALEYISTGQVPVKDLITRHIPLDDVMSAFDIVAKGEAIKVTVEP